MSAGEVSLVWLASLVGVGILVCFIIFLTQNAGRTRLVRPSEIPDNVIYARGAGAEGSWEFRRLPSPTPESQRAAAELSQQLRTIEIKTQPLEIRVVSVPPEPEKAEEKTEGQEEKAETKAEAKKKEKKKATKAKDPKSNK